MRTRVGRNRTTASKWLTEALMGRPTLERSSGEHASTDPSTRDADPTTNQGALRRVASGDAASPIAIVATTWHCRLAIADPF